MNQSAGELLPALFPRLCTRLGWEMSKLGRLMAEGSDDRVLGFRQAFLEPVDGKMGHQGVCLALGPVTGVTPTRRELRERIARPPPAG